MQKIQRYKQKPLKWFYNAFVPKNRRKLAEKQAKLTQQAHLAECWQELIGLYRQNKLPHFTITPKKQFTHQKIIWQYWGQGVNGDLPDIVKLCFKSVDKYKGDYQVIRLDDDNLSDYLEFPDFVFEKRQNPQFKPAFFADILRLALLYHYGGVWVDATILLTAPIDERILAQDFFMFSRHPNAGNQDFWENFNADYFGWHKHHYVNILNSFIVAKQGNNLAYDSLQLMLNFWHTQNHITHYFFFQIMFDVLTERGTMPVMLPMDDTLPHLLISRLNEPFNQHDFEQICKQTQIHKLTYIKECKKGSYYDHIRQSLNP
ncbi:capsular polysaccharide synthesis protein [Moraxella nasibovis]|uniref:capsular polysaccharide synthesis protein n=1 Tax=Moraxella nasibovis TaxID=2904120 RepID=UPI00240FB08F|nr:capsular polysaccharide synthesis protein [Moraxella nasibovis]WFF39528.1 capsular polysaccharide synthesis protein [Moraxella nasibovis]